MRASLFAACLMSVSAAAAEDLNARAHPLPLPLNEQRNAARQADPPKREVLGDALGNWMGVKDGHWDVFDAALFDDGTSGSEAKGPTIAGTVRKDAAEIQLRWHPGE
jgi:hypothetical protein